MEDIRIYYYFHGQLKKVAQGRKPHKQTSVKDAEAVVNSLKENKRLKAEQYVLVKYSAPFKSKIIKVL